MAFQLIVIVADCTPFLFIQNDTSLSLRVIKHAKMLTFFLKLTYNVSMYSFIGQGRFTDEDLDCQLNLIRQMVGHF